LLLLLLLLLLMLCWLAGRYGQQMPTPDSPNSHLDLDGLRSLMDVMRARLTDSQALDAALAGLASEIEDALTAIRQQRRSRHEVSHQEASNALALA
jgi:hypothetical protein